jgi:hypothetical protein
VSLSKNAMTLKPKQGDIQGEVMSNIITISPSEIGGFGELPFVAQTTKVASRIERRKASRCVVKPSLFGDYYFFDVTEYETGGNK